MPAVMWEVNTTGDLPDANLADGLPSDGNGNVSLRAAVMQANANALAQPNETFEIRFLWMEVGPPVVIGQPQPPPGPGNKTIQLTQEMNPFSANIAVIGPGMAHLEIVGAGERGMFKIETDSTSSISGLLLRDGVNKNVNGGTGRGGAIDNLGVFSLSNVKIQGCRASNGGAVSNLKHLAVSDCQFVANGTFPANAGVGFGGAIDTGLNSTTTITGSLFDTNIASARGGSVSVRFNAEVEIMNTTIMGSSAFAGVGVYNSGGTLLLSGCELLYNASDSAGGGLEHSGGTSTIINTTFKENRATVRGGGIYAGSGTLSFSGGVIDNNRAKNGAGVYSDGGTVSFTGATIKNNQASEWGGGFYVTGGTLSLTTCKMADNTATSGGAKIAKAGNPTITVSADCTGVTAADIENVP